MAPLSVRVSDNNQSFLEQMAERGTSKTDLVNRALDLLRKAQLQSELSSLAMDSSVEDAALAEEGMQDYLTLLDDAA